MNYPLRLAGAGILLLSTMALWAGTQDQATVVEQPTSDPVFNLAMNFIRRFSKISEI